MFWPFLILSRSREMVRCGNESLYFSLKIKESTFWNPGSGFTTALIYMWQWRKTQWWNFTSFWNYSSLQMWYPTILITWARLNITSRSGETDSPCLKRKSSLLRLRGNQCPRRLRLWSFLGWYSLVIQVQNEPVQVFSWFLTISLSQALLYGVILANVLNRQK